MIELLTFFAIWFSIGYILSLVFILIISKKITSLDLFISIILSVIGPMFILVILSLPIIYFGAYLFGNHEKLDKIVFIDFTKKGKQNE